MTCSDLPRPIRLALLGLFAASTLATAQDPQPGQVVRLQPIAPRVERLTPVQEGRGAFEALRRDRTTITVRGVVQNTEGHLVPLAGIIRLRSLTDGTVAGQGEVDSLAQFAITGCQPGIYTAELIGRSGAILVTTSAFSAKAGEIIQLAPVIPTRRSGIAAAFETVTSLIVTSAASAGILVVNQGQPVTPQ